MVRQPKWGHLRDVHKAIKLCEPALIAAEPSYSSLGQNTEVCDPLFRKVTNPCIAEMSQSSPLINEKER